MRTPQQTKDHGTEMNRRFQIDSAILKRDIKSQLIAAAGSIHLDETPFEGQIAVRVLQAALSQPFITERIELLLIFHHYRFEVQVIVKRPVNSQKIILIEFVKLLLCQHNSASDSRIRRLNNRSGDVAPLRTVQLQQQDPLPSTQEEFAIYYRHG